MSIESPMRFGIMLNDHSIAQWQLDAIDQLKLSGLAIPVLIIINSSESASNESFIKKILRHDSLFRFLIHRLYKVPAENKIPLPPALTRIDAMVCKPNKINRFSEFFAEEDVKKVAGLGLDFILRFGFGIIRGGILESAKYGVWSFHHGDERFFRGGPFGFWEVAKRNNTTGVILQKLTNKLDSGVVLLRRHHRTVFHSWKEMRQRLLHSNSDMPLCAVKAIMSNAIDFALLSASSTDAKIYKTPSNGRMLFFMLQLYCAKIKFHFRDLFIHERWRLAYSRLGQDVLNGMNVNAKLYYPDRKSSFLADGFLLSGGDEPVILCEEYNHMREIGTICCLADNKRNTALSHSYHLAFPYVFDHDGKTYVMPESAESKTLPIYSFDRKTKELKFLKNIMEGQCIIDPAWCFYNGFFWLFCGLKGQEPNEKLFLFFSDKLDGDYKPHPLNPIKVDPHGSRSAGTIFFRNGALIRPAQVSIKFYGEYISMQRITKLSPFEFSEESIGEIKPQQFGAHYKGLHTFSIIGNDVLVDLKNHRFNTADFRRRWRNKLRKKR